MLSALASSNSLPTISHFRCRHNQSWFSEGKESNVELLSDAIRAMTNLRYLNLEHMALETEEMCDLIVNAIVESQKQDP